MRSGIHVAQTLMDLVEVSYELNKNAVFYVVHTWLTTRNVEPSVSM
jgi:hypothetical protein